MTSQPPYSYPAPSPRPRNQGPDDEVDFSQLLGVLRHGKWIIAGFVAGTLVLGAFYLFVADPVYQASALLQIKPEDTSPLQGLTTKLDQVTGRSSSLAAPEMQIMKSRSVVGHAIEQLHLDTVAQPQYFPIVGEAIARRRQRTAAAVKTVPAGQGSWLSHYAWAPTNIEITRFDVPDALHGSAFTLRALGGGRFILFGPEGKRILHGAVGKAASGRAPSGAPVRIFVQALAVGAPPTDFHVVHNALLNVFSTLAQKLNITEQGDETGIVKITLEGSHRERITAIVNAVAQRYLQQNVEARSQQAAKSLEFLDHQLPRLKSKVDAADAKLAAFRQHSKQSVDLTAEAQSLLDRTADLQDKQSKLKLKIAELRQRYTNSYPAVQAARDQMRQLIAQQKRLQHEIDKLPDAVKDVVRLRRNVKVNTELYTALLNRAQQLRVVKAGTVGNARIIDNALEPVKAVAPKPKLVLILSVILGAIFGCAYLFARAALRKAVDDPKEIENQLGLPIYAVVPYSPWLARFSRRPARRRKNNTILARDHAGDNAVEAIRSLRTSLYFAQMDNASNIVLITGPAPGVGKSFISANLAYLQAEANQRVVLVDADMRRGQLHQLTDSQQRDPGLSRVLSGQVALQDALRVMPGSTAYLLPSGQLPPNPSELLMRPEFGQLLQALKTQFDLVLIDAPPALAVTDAAVISASQPDIVTFIVARAGTHSMREIEECASRLSQRDRKVAGAVFNGLKRSHAEYGGGYNYYHYDYKAKA